MFDFASKAQLALEDKARRTGMKAGAGVLALFGLGYLLSALWNFLAFDMELGRSVASLIIGAVFVLAAVVLMMLSKKEKHPMPSTDELKHEVQTRVSLAADAALDKAKFKAEEAMDSAQNRVATLFGRAERKVYEAEDKVYDLRDSVSHMAEDAVAGAARKVGLTPETIREARDNLDRATDSRAAPGVGLIGAFAVGLTIARALGGSRRDDDDYPYYDDDYYA